MKTQTESHTTENLEHLSNLNSEEFREMEVAHLLKSITPTHPVLNRIHGHLKAASGVNIISGYDRMHHRHNRS